MPGTARPLATLLLAVCLTASTAGTARAAGTGVETDVATAAADELPGGVADEELLARIEQAIAEAGTALEDAEQQVADVKAQREALEAELADAQARVEQAEAALTTARNELDDVTSELATRRHQHARERDLLRTEVRESWKETTGGSSVALGTTIGIMDAAGTGREALRQLDVLRYVLDQRADEVKTLEELAAESAALRRALRQLGEQRRDDVATATAARDDATAAAERVRVVEAQAEETAAARAQLLTALEERGARAADRRARLEAALAALDGALHATGHGSAPAELLVFGNGRVPGDALTSIGVGGHRLWEPAAVAFTELLAAAEAHGIRIGVTDSYRSYEAQVDVARRKGLYSEGGLAARPGTSNHGWGLSVDLDLDAPALDWMREHAGDYGFVEDTPREPWHWTFTAAHPH